MDWSIVLDVGVGVGVFALGVGTFIAMLALVKVLARVRITLDEVDRQLARSGKPLGETLDHVNGITDTADQALARLSGVVKSFEDISGSVAGTVTLTKQAVSPAIVNVGAALSGISAGLRRLVTGKTSTDEL